ncbi:hypothetical protein VE03_03822 [Pseudogymnoascus sp. 23342-1-I1]|nr:hypothetical protein VE03_03822 [Pseudogymnoascus sp. 23342-1-I1]
MHLQRQNWHQLMQTASNIPHTKSEYAQGKMAVVVAFEMLSRRIGRIQRLGAVAQVARPAGAIQKRCLSQADVEDPNMNGGYLNPPPVKRQFRDPNGDWWDKQQRRNYGEPVHEDDDILGLFTPEEYTHTKPATAFFQIGCFITAVFGLCGVVYVLYPDKQSYPKEYEGGLEKELGGPGVTRARKAGDPYE